MKTTFTLSVIPGDPALADFYERTGLSWRSFYTMDLATVRVAETVFCSADTESHVIQCFNNTVFADYRVTTLSIQSEKVRGPNVVLSARQHPVHRPVAPWLL